MTDKKYKVIVSDRAKRMLGAHIRFMAQVNKDAADTKKKEIVVAIRSLKNGIWFFIRYRMIRYMWSILLIAEKIITG